MIMIAMNIAITMMIMDDDDDDYLVSAAHSYHVAVIYTTLGVAVETNWAAEWTGFKPFNSNKTNDTA